MKKRLLHIITSGLVLASASNATAQMVGTNCYLQGTYLEIGMNNNASFGTCNPQGAIPAGYHQHMSGSGIPPAGNNLAEVYDYGHDGWTVGAPPYMGDYTYPGSPFEGWMIQIGTDRARAFQNCAGTTGALGLTLAGSLTGYTAGPTYKEGLWTGTATSPGGNLAIRQQTRVDNLGSAVVVTTTMVNTGATATGTVYYLRTCDPDNSQTWSPFTFNTVNRIVHQNEDARHRVLVSSRGNGYPGDVAYMGLGTKDCRAKCFCYTGWGGWSGASWDLAGIWSESPTGMGTALFTLGGSQSGDFAIGLVYNIGSIPAGDSAIISYAYIFNGDLGIDSAFPDPALVVNNDTMVSWAPPTPNYDTLNACELPGLVTVPADILNATDRGWSWSTWTWSPALGLATTTGVSNVITLAGLPPIITYTITGTDSASGMMSCHNKTFYLTIISCNNAVANSPCVGDTLFLNAPGDSVGATYQWYGPAPSTAVFATTQAYSIFPASLSHAGTYSVIKTVMGSSDTSTVDVTINALPVITASSNQVLCDPIVDPLLLNALSDSAAVSWEWSGPGGFTASVQSPTVSPFDSSLQGIYQVTVVSTDGCVGIGNVLVKPGPVADFNFDRHPGCPNDSVSVVNLSVHGATYEWSWGDGTKSYTANPGTHIYPTPSGGNVYNVSLTATSANGCTDTKTQSVDLRHTVTASFNYLDDTICNTPQQLAMINNTSSASLYGAPAPIVSYNWVYTDGHTDATATPPDHAFPEEGVYKVSLNIEDELGCTSSTDEWIWVLQPYIRAIVDSSFCLTTPMAILVSTHTDNVPEEYNYSYAWTPSTDLSSDTARRPIFNGIGDYTYSITATLDHEGCTGSHVMTLHSKLPTPILNLTEDTRIKYGESIQLNSSNTLYYVWQPNDGSLSNNNINNPIATPSVTTTYTVTGMDYYGCKVTRTVTVIVDSTADEFIPTAFTPNGDGLNDVFRLIGSKFHTMVEFRVYNRWGQQVFYTDTREKGWDGTFNGQPAPMGVYHYTVIVARPGHDHNQVIKGEVTLIR